MKGIIMKDITTRARLVANIFDITAWVVLGIGVLLAIIAFFRGVSGGLADSWGGSFTNGIILAAIVLVYSALSWACITLASIIAGYIQNRS
jgi:hypothetical protein